MDVLVGSSLWAWIAVSVGAEEEEMIPVLALADEVDDAAEPRACEPVEPGPIVVGADRLVRDDPDDFDPAVNGFLQRLSDFPADHVLVFEVDELARGGNRIEQLRAARLAASWSE